ncbi:MAG: hypothetical protein HY961_03225 [Ignavibacteriae bacterium]|nr:hypothetical protein [Ignavibacteriota bacterium]
MAIPTTVDDAPVEERLLIVFPLTFTVVDVLLQVRPVTFPPVPVADKPVIMFEFTESVVALPFVPIDNPVIAA